LSKKKKKKKTKKKEKKKKKNQKKEKKKKFKKRKPWSPIGGGSSLPSRDAIQYQLVKNGGGKRRTFPNFNVVHIKGEDD